MDLRGLNVKLIKAATADIYYLGALFLLKTFLHDPQRELSYFTHFYPDGLLLEWPSRCSGSGARQ